jgi:hypothetical protein
LENFLAKPSTALSFMSFLFYLVSFALRSRNFGQMATVDAKNINTGFFKKHCVKLSELPLSPLFASPLLQTFRTNNPQDTLLHPQDKASRFFSWGIFGLGGEGG